MTGPQRFGSYAIVGEIARGGQGVVYRAQDPSGRAVALKLLVEPDAATAKRFGQEARVLAKLTHPNLLQVFEYGEHEGTHFLAIELIDGQDLFVLCKEHGLPGLDWLAPILISVALTLEHCHLRGVIHRDLKPANIVVERATHRPVLVDFGLVKRDPNQMHLTSVDEGSALSLSGTIKGTPEYMAPEQVNPGEFGDVGAATDVYGLGAVLYHLLTGGPPFTGRAAVIVMRKVTRKAPKDPRELNPSLPAPLVDFCLRCLAKRSTERPQSALAFARELARVAGLPVPAAPAPPGSGEFEATVEVAAQETPLLPGRMPAAGETFAGFQIVKSIASGGSGSVFVARDHKGGVHALKVLRAGLSDDEKRGRFEREAEVGRELAHSGVVAIQGAGVEDGMPFLVMEYLEGSVPIDAFASARGLSVTGRLELMLQLVQAMEAAHGVELIHRDLKPDNVLVTPDGQVKVVDFGLAKHLDKERMTMSGVMLGTVRYMAPEQVMGRAAQADARTDVYAAGVIFYELLSGERPFEGRTAVEIMAGILSDDPPDPCRGLAEVPEGLPEVVRKAMAREPEARYPNAAAFGRDLAALAASRSGAVSALDEHRARRRIRVTLAALAVVACLLFVVAAGLWWSKRSAREDPETQRREAGLVGAEAWGLFNAERPLRPDASRVAALRSRLDALLGGEEPGDARLVAATRRVVALEGLLALTRGDDAQARSALTALRGDEGAAACALAGAIAASSSDSDPGVASRLLSRAIARGVARPELRAWRAQARARAGLESGGDAQQVLDDLQVAEAALGPLGTAGRVCRARASLALDDADAAAQAVEGVDAPLDLRWAIALERADKIVHEHPEQALAWLEVLPQQETRDPRQWSLGRRARARLEDLVSSAPRTEAELVVVLVHCRLVRILLEGEPLGAKLAEAISGVCTGFDSLGTTGPAMEIAVTLSELCPNSVKIQREVGYQSQRYRSRGNKVRTLPALRRLIEIEPLPEARFAHKMVLAKTLAFLVVESPSKARLADELRELEQLIAEVDADSEGAEADFQIFCLRFAVARASGDLEGALAFLDRALELADRHEMQYHRMKLLRELGRRDEAIPAAGAFLLGQVEGSIRAGVAAEFLWKQRSEHRELARRAAERHVQLNPRSPAAWVRIAWFRLQNREAAALAMGNAAAALARSDDAKHRALVARAKALVSAIESGQPSVGTGLVRLADDAR